MSSPWDASVLLHIPAVVVSDLTPKNDLFETEGVRLICYQGKEILRTFDKERRVEIKYCNDIKQ